jgi:hypothetical protein
MLGADHGAVTSPSGHRDVVPTGYGRRVGPLITLFENLVLRLPVLAVLIVGLVLVSAPGRFPARGARLARAGLLLMLANEVLSLGWTVFYPHVLIRRTYAEGGLSIAAIGYLSAAVSFVLGVVFAVGLALLVFGLVTGRREPTAPTVPAGYAPTGYAPTGYAPTGYAAAGHAAAGYAPPYGAVPDVGPGSGPAAAPLGPWIPVEPAPIPFQSGDTTGQPGDTTGRPGDTTGRSGDVTGRSGDVTGRVVPDAQDPWRAQ